MVDWNALYKVSLGLYVLGAKDGNRPVGSIVDAVMIAANKPCALAVSCGNLSYTKACIEKDGEFSISVLPKNINPWIIANFGFRSSKDNDKWSDIPHSELDGLPVLDDATAHITAKIVHQYALDSNTVFIAEIINAVNCNNNENLLYEDYRNALKDDVIKSFQQYMKEKANG